MKNPDFLQCNLFKNTIGHNFAEDSRMILGFCWEK